MALPSWRSEPFAEFGVPVTARPVPLLDAVTVPLKEGLLTTAMVGVAPLIEATLEPAVKRDEMFWNVGVPAPADVRIWWLAPAAVKLYALPVPKAIAPAVGVAVVLVPPLAIGNTPLTSLLARLIPPTLRTP